MTKSQKRTIDLLSATSAAGIASYMTLQRTKSIKEILLIGLGVGVLIYLISNQVTKLIQEEQDKPANIPVPVDITALPNGQLVNSNTVTTGFDALALARAVKEDCYCFWCLRNKDVYNQLLGLSNTDFVAVVNAWNKNFFSLEKETMRQAISNESDFWDKEFGALRKALEARFNQLKIS